MFGEQGFDMNALLAQAQAMQSQIARAQEELAAKQVLGGRYTFLEEGIVPPSGEGPWVSPVVPGPSEKPDIRRHIPRPG